MRSIWSLYKAARDNDDDNTLIAANVTAIASLDTKVGSQGGVLVGSNTVRVSNVASPPAAIPAAGTVLWSTTSKVAMFSDGTSMFTAEGSLMG